MLRPNGALVVVFNGTLHRPRGLAGVIEWLYRITGQREPLDLCAPFVAAGFAARLEAVALASSTAHVLVATKILRSYGGGGGGGESSSTARVLVATKIP